MKHRTRDCSHLLTIDYANTFLTLMRENRGLTIRQLHQAAMHHTAPCWYISPTQAMRFINRMIADKEITCSDRRRRMYYDLYKCVRSAKQVHPEKELHNIVNEVVDSPAPEFYISLRTAYRLLSRYRQYRRAISSGKSN
jgi:hypothetical protein